MVQFPVNAAQWKDLLMQFRSKQQKWTWHGASQIMSVYPPLISFPFAKYEVQENMHQGFAYAVHCNKYMYLDQLLASHYVLFIRKFYGYSVL